MPDPCWGRNPKMYVLILGPAASGKTLLTASFGTFLRERFAISQANLDPGAGELPYVPDFDVRSSFTLQSVMREEGLGPNGAMLRAMDRLAGMTIPRFSADFVLLDAPGQLEPFVFRNAAANLVRRLPEACCIYVIDATSPTQTLPSLMLYSLAAQFASGAPAVNVMNKVDLLTEGERRRIYGFLADPRSFVNVEGEGVRWEMNVQMAEMMRSFLPSQRPCFVSAKTGEGFEELLDMLREVKCACGDLT